MRAAAGLARRDPRGVDGEVQVRGRFAGGPQQTGGAVDLEEVAARHDAWPSAVVSFVL